MSGTVEESLQMPFELESLSKAVNYQRWVAEAVVPLMGRRILEVGAGIGNMSQWLPVGERLVLTDTEPVLLDALQQRLPAYYGDAVDRVSVVPLDLGRLETIERLAGEEFDTVVSFNVLEHIEDDREAIARLLDVLRASYRPVRRLVSFVPAQAWALSDLDRYYGHFRRYSSARIEELTHELAPGATLSLDSFNAVGLVGWVWQTMILKRITIDAGSVRTFDAICPYLKPFDNFLCRTLGYPLGQSWIWVITLPAP